MCTKKCTFLYTDLPPDGTKIPSEYDTILFRESLLHLGRAHIRYGLCVVGHSGLFWQTCKTSLHSFLFYHTYIYMWQEEKLLPHIRNYQDHHCFTSGHHQKTQSHFQCMFDHCSYNTAEKKAKRFCNTCKSRCWRKAPGGRGHYHLEESSDKDCRISELSD